MGVIGEQCAAMFLQRRGAAVVDRNVRVDGGEIDLLVELDGSIIAIEVKTIVGAGDPLERIDTHKREVVYRSVAGLGRRIDRVDAIAVQLFDDHVAVRWVPYL